MIYYCCPISIGVRFERPQKAVKNTIDPFLFNNQLVIVSNKIVYFKPDNIIILVLIKTIETNVLLLLKGDPIKMVIWDISGHG